MTSYAYNDAFKEVRLLRSPTPLFSTTLLEKNRILRVIGPVRIEVVKGCIRVLGTDICSSQSIYISRYRSYAIKATTDSMVNFLIGEGGTVEQPSEGEEVIDLWEQAAGDIVKEGRRVVVVGAVDSGKTSFSTLLSNIALECNLRPAIIDADVGQCDLAPPGFIALKFMKSKVVWLRELKGDTMRFIGYTTPSTSTAMSRIISAIMELIDIAENNNSDLVIVNTDGWFGDLMSIEYKITLIKSIKPKSVVALGMEACSIISNVFRGSLVKMYCLPKPRLVRCRNREDRRELRRLNYSTYFKEAKRVCLEINNIALLGSCLFSGEPLSDEFIQNLSKELEVNIIAASRYDDLIIVMVPDNVDAIQIKQREGIDIVKPGNAKGLISAIVNETFEEQDIAVIDEFDPIGKRICLLTPYRGAISGIVIGRIKVDEYWNDKGKVPKCPI
ncbi:MAG: Clp1/GlmU family protein [Ignisphaera sp.]|nr:Clp1/GlmU family protein [Ignisphaera sp.]MCX8167904.1 Clp1/GlmU family protein [Ignisphaera sp.]MDW8085719.1 Clp1/GlmU family protein [Ignisphaera sp.]